MTGLTFHVGRLVPCSTIVELAVESGIFLFLPWSTCNKPSQTESVVCPGSARDMENYGTSLFL